MTRLLVSVRNAAEARVAVRHGADVIDVKEPSRGSLGAADSGAILAAASAVGNQALLSAALGELRDFRPPGPLPPSLTFAKVGLSACADWPEWSTAWRRAMASLPVTVERVAVIYADRQAARSPDRREVIELSAAWGYGVALVDTFDKSAGGLLDHWTLAETRKMIELAHSKGLAVALAGSLTAEAISTLAPLRPDFVAVRGAACREGRRQGGICADRVARLASLVHDLSTVHNLSTAAEKP